MATNRKIYQIKLEDISQNGTLCRNPSVEFEKPYCAEVRCYTEESDGDIVLKVEIPEDCPDPCVYAIIDCQDDCGECEPERIKICPCTEDSDCPDCSVCTNNLCTSTCPTGEYCYNGDCVECDPTKPCPGNQVCVNGDCQCPPDKPFKDSKGNCSNCESDTQCPACFTCSANGCVPIICPVGECDPTVGGCVECTGSGDCTGDNECCVNKKCDCCFGFVRDRLTGDCIPDPGCLTDGDCPECEICTNTGCEQPSCPPGYVFTGNYPACCEPICDCDDKDCPGRQNCVRLNDTTCYCATCVGTCGENGDCGEGCYCNNGQCTINQCYGLCFDGSDCGPGCGCFEGRCQPCNSLNCAGISCAQADGCECVGSNCAESPCDGTCVNGSDCGFGCGCYQGRCRPCSTIGCDQCKYALGCDCLAGTCTGSPCKSACVDGDDCGGVDCGCFAGECVSCQAYTCTNQACPNGCICGSGGICQGNPCRSSSCENNGDCGINCSCISGQCTPCPPSDPNCGSKPCGDLIILGKNDETCELEATLTQQACCNCRDIAVDVNLNAGVTSYANTITFRVGDAGSVGHVSLLPSACDALDATGNPVKLKTDAKFRLTRKMYYAGASSPNIFTQEYVIPASGTGCGTTINEPAISVDDYPGGKNGVVKIEYYATSLTATFQDDCEYTLPAEVKLFEYKASSGPNGFMAARTNVKEPGLQLQKLTPCRSPIFSFFRGSTASALNGVYNTVPFAYAYGDGIPTSSPNQKVWKATIGAEDGLEYLAYYKVKVDCGCAKEAVYACDSQSTTPSPLAFCDIKDSEIDFSFVTGTNCTQFQFNSNITLGCNVMGITGPCTGGTCYDDGDCGPDCKCIPGSPLGSCVLKNRPKYRVTVNGGIVNSIAPIQPTLSGGNAILNLTGLGVINYGAAVDKVGIILENDPCDQCDAEASAPTCTPFAGGFNLLKAACDVSGNFGVQITTNAEPLEEIAYTISDSSGLLASGTFFNTNKNVIGIPDPLAGANPITVGLTRISDGVTVSEVKLYDPASYSASSKMILTYGCSGTQSYVNGGNAFGSSATLSVYEAGTSNLLNAASVGAQSNATVTFPEDTTVDIVFSLNADPTCSVTETDVVINCCDDIDPLQIEVATSCISVDDILVEMGNNHSFPVIFEIYDPSGFLLTTRVVTANSFASATLNNVVNGTHSVRVKSSTSSDCPATVVHNFDASSCCDELMALIGIEIQCLEGNGPGAVGTLIVTNNTIGPKTMQVYLITGATSSLIYQGNDPVFDYRPRSAPSNTSVKVVVEGCEKTESVNFNCEQ